MVGVAAWAVAMGAEPAGYLSRGDRDPGRIRLESPPKPPVPPLAPLPQTYVPEPQFTAEFLSELRTTSAMYRTNFTVKADTVDPLSLRMAPAFSPPTDPGPAGVGEDADKSRRLLGYFLTQVVPTNGMVPGTSTSSIPLNVILPLKVSSGDAPARGSARATYELR